MTDQHTTHPLVAAYLRDLDSLLAGLGPGDRAEVLTGVREHIDSALEGRPTPGSREVQAVLAELGPPEAVADEAYAGLPATSALAAPPRRPVLEQPWVPVVVFVLLGLALVVTEFSAGALNGYGTSGTASVASDGTVLEEQTFISFNTTFPTVMFMSLTSSVMLWVPATVLVWLSPLWTQRERLHLTLLTPLAAGAVSILPQLGWLLTRAELGINVGAWTGLALGLGGGFWVLWRHTRAARQRAGA